MADGTAHHLIPNMPFCLNIDLQLLGFDVAFRTHIKNINPSIGKLTQYINQHTHPVIQGFGDKSRGIVTRWNGKFRSQYSVTSTVVRRHFTLKNMQTVGLEHFFRSNDTMPLLLLPGNTADGLVKIMDA